MTTRAEKRAVTIRAIVPNLRERWRLELAPYSDNAIANLYEHFSLSEDAGDNDAQFPTWFDMLPDYEKGEVE